MNTPKPRSVITWLEDCGHRLLVHLATYDHHHSVMPKRGILWPLNLHQIKMQRHAEWSPQEEKEVTAEVGVGQNSKKGVQWKFLIRYIKAAILQFLKEIKAAISEVHWNIAWSGIRTCPCHFDCGSPVFLPLGRFFGGLHSIVRSLHWLPEEAIWASIIP